MAGAWPGPSGGGAIRGVAMARRRREQGPAGREGAGPGPDWGVLKARREGRGQGLWGRGQGLAWAGEKGGGLWRRQRIPSAILGGGGARTLGHAHDVGTKFLWKAEPRLLKTISSCRSALTNTFPSGFMITVS